LTEKRLDVRGKACPQPVIETRKILTEEAPASLRVVLDNAASAENVTRMARTLGWQARLDQERDGELHLVIHPNDSPATASEARAEAESESESCGRASQNVVLINSDRFGDGAEELGEILMRSFLKTLLEVVPRPQAALFINRGIYLTIEGSKVLDDLRRLADGGVQIFSCGTCLDYYGEKEKLAVGKVTNMFEVVSLLSAADRVIRP
jgi:tRNA 2-thiouridine synthesizing protein A